jgi:aryl-alcohol dehydrogenase-like predicted oxidoreductase
MAYAPLSRGLLSGGIAGRADLTADDWRRGLPRFAADAIGANAALAHELAGFARHRDLTIAQLAIAWVLAQGENVQALIGTRRRSHLTENLGAAQVVLSAADLAGIDAITGGADVLGNRYPDMSHVNA